MNAEKKRLFFIINDLGGGGAEKVLLDTIQNLDKNKFIIDVCTIFDNGVYDDIVKRHVHKYTKLYSLKKYPIMLRKYIKFFILRRIKYFPCYSLVNKNRDSDYDFEISFLEGPATKILSYSISTAKKYAWVHVDPIVLPYSTKYYLSLKQEKKIYNKFDMILCVSSDVKESFISKYGISNNVNVQLNVLDERSIKKKAIEPFSVDFLQESVFKIISIGRLMSQKSYIRLLKVILKLSNDFKDFKLIIVGDGNERKNLEKFVRDNNMSNYVCIYGFCENPYAILSKCDLFVCSSLTEGFSTVVTESVVLGIPVLTTRCAGMEDILGDSEYGMIVENDEISLYEGLYDILKDREKYLNLQIQVKKRIDFFKVEQRIKELESLFLGQQRGKNDQNHNNDANI